MPPAFYGYGNPGFPVPPGPSGLYGYGGYAYGYGAGVFPRPPVSTTGGYGGATYGLSSYGSVDVDPPRVTGVRSIDGFTIELTFSEEMEANAALTSPASYTITPILGAVVTIESVTISTATTLLIEHTGTTLGGQYTLTVVGVLLDKNGYALLPGTNTATFYSLGTNPTATVAVVDGTHISVTLSENLVPESDWSPGAGDLSSYTVSTDYPITPTLESIETPVGGDYSKISIELIGMTATDYGLLIGPSSSVDYAGTELPSAATGFDGVEIGTGTSEVSTGTLLMSKSAGVLYGWAFEDTSGRVVSGCTFRVDVAFDASIAIVTPTLTDGTLATLTFSDGSVEITLSMAKVSGIDILDITSGTYTAQIPIEWSTGPIIVSMLRNAIAGMFSVLVNGVPIVSASDTLLDGTPTTNAGATFTLSPVCAVSNFELDTVIVTASSTVFTTSWNFIHGLTSPFVGSAANARTKLMTQRGPIVRNWGDWTPATISDVEIRVNGVPVELAGINPYTGEIYPTIPIPLTPPGTATVEVDYAWFATPAFPITGLNIEGLVLNKWDLPVGQQSGVGSPTDSIGAMDTMRFPYGIALWPLTPPQPYQVSPRYIGFEREYSATTNSPTTLLLNQNPNAIVRGDLSITPTPTYITYEGTTTPTASGWGLTENSVDAGYVGSNAYVLVCDQTLALYTQDITVQFPSAVTVAAQIKVDAYNPSGGVLVGPVMGFHDDDRLYLAGPIIVGGMRHMGILVDAARPDLETSWEVGPAVTIQIIGTTTFTTTSSLFARIGTTPVRFRISDGVQSGEYEVLACGVETEADGSYTVSVTPPFPADPNTFGGDAATVYIETRWDEQPINLRLVADTVTRNIVLYMGGVVASSTIAVGELPATTEPADTYLTLPTQGGAVVWGTLTQSTSTWAFVRASVNPNAATYHYRGSTTTVPTDTTPDTPIGGWFVEESFGYGSVNAGYQIIDHTATSTTPVGAVFGYTRTEPFLDESVVIDFDFTFVVETASGTGGGQIVIDNGIRRVVGGTVAYVEGGTPYRRLATVPTVSILGTRNPTVDGWDIDTTSAASIALLNFRGVSITATSGQSYLWGQDLDVGGDGSLDTVADAEFQTDAPGPVLRIPANGRIIELGVSASPAQIVLGSGVATFPFSWDDGQPHRYRILTNATADAVSVVADGVVLGVATLSDFPVGTRRVVFGVDSVTTTCNVIWFAVAAHPLFNSDVKRTLGIASPHPNADITNIDGWTLPRSDGTSVPNSSALADIVPMDWGSEMRVRVRLDPQWGATLYRPDLPLPTGGAWATDTTQPSAGWVNVEYPRLPQSTQAFGCVSFGGLYAPALSRSRWGDVRYQIRTVNSSEFIAPQGMVLNRYNVITSGELRNDTQPEVVIVPIVGNQISLVPSNINASRVFTVVVGSTVLPVANWTFDASTQTITLNGVAHTGDATVTFVPGTPVTPTYLCSQPLHQGNTILNEGTPPVPASQRGDAVRTIVSGAAINDPGDVLVDPAFTLNDPTRYVTFTDPEEDRYTDLQFCEVDNGGQRNLIATLCDGPAIGHGLAEIALSGTMVSEQQSADGLSLIHI